MPESSNNRPKILIVDDVPANLFALNALLGTVDADVLQASNGNDALAMALDHDFSMILLDVQMPEMDGYEVAEFLRSYTKTQHVPIIFITAIFKGEEYQVKGYSVGAVDYIEKPINEEFLIAKVNVFLKLHRQKLHLKHEQRKTEITLSAIPDPVITVQGSDIVYMNGAALSLSRVFGHTKQCTSLIDLFGFSPSNLEQILNIVDSVSGISGEQDLTLELTFSSLHSSNDYIYEFKVVPLRGMSDFSEEVILVFHDISNLRSLSKEMAYQATHDPLTGCSNRRYFEDVFKNAVTRFIRNKRNVAIMLIDLDNFKDINDSIGHTAGDEALRIASKRIQEGLRDVDSLCRIGGDEFCVLFEEVESLELLEIPAKRIIESLSKPFILENEECTLGASIGVTSTLIDPDRDAAGMLSDADLAMYEAKHQGKNRYIFFKEDMRQHLQDKLALDKELINAISKLEFCLHYQPQIDIKTGLITGLEALIRWNHPEKGLVSPVYFLSTLESTGLIKTVGSWVIVEACRQIQEWHRLGFVVPCVSVNVSPKQFEEKGFPDFVKNTMDKYGVSPKELGIEITETLFMESTLLVEDNLRQLHDMGCKISLDDFGTGYSALSYLIRFPIDVIKIDQAFIKRLASHPQYQDMVTAIIQMAHGFSGMKVISEGVEKVSVLSMLNEMNCDSYQGFLHSKPLPSSEVVKKLVLESDVHKVKYLEN